MPSPPVVINDRYQIQKEPLGQGGMGIVYKAWDTVTKRHVALKTMRGRLDAGALELFSKEWTVLSRLNHPNIVDIFDSGDFEEDGEAKPFFVMPLLPGRTFDYLIRNSSPRLTVERVIEIILQTCRGLHAAHEQGLVHRDLKPSNIFVMDDDTVKIIDFGVVHLTGTDSVAGLKGTLQYMAPEQIEMKPTSPASDIFSLSVVCYEALTGRKPFARKTEAETVDALRRHIPPPACELNPLVSQLLSRVIHKAMAKAPYHRFSTAREYSETLQKALNNQPIERFDKAKTQPRIDRAKKAQAEGDFQFASEVLTELEAEGHIDPEMTVLRIQIDQAIRQKSIRQLLDSARTRREEDEFPLALQKLQEVLAIDPDNADALSLRSDIEKQSGEKQVENWFRLADQHIHNHSLSQAGQALNQILKTDPSNSRARQLLADVERREQEINRLRVEKEQLYRSALGNYQEGAISSALSKLERVMDLNRASPDSAIPDRDAQYQGLYNQIRTEREAARNSYAEGKRYLTDKNFSKALEVCAEFLKKQPADPLFQALKLEAEENERQEHSAFIAEVSRRAESEPDLDRRVNILKEAAERYPDEPHFQQSLRLIRERRDLVNAIVAKARQHEDRGLFGEALGQWDILRNIYAQYPGLGFEVERLMRRRDEQVRDEVKAKWVEQIDRHLASGENSKARDAARAAATEFPNDPEFTGLEKLVQQAVARAAEAEEWLQRGQQLCFDRQYADGLESLQKAAALDKKNSVIRAALLNALVEHARSLLGQDWRAAEPLIQQALGIDGGHPLAKNLQGLVLDYKRQEVVNQSITKARELQADGDLTGALAVVEQALTSLPNEARLVQLRSTLRNLIGPLPEESANPSLEGVHRPVAPPAAPIPKQEEFSSYSVDQSIVRTEFIPIPAKAATPPPRTTIFRKLGDTSGRVWSRVREVYGRAVQKGPQFSRFQWGSIALFLSILVVALVASVVRKPRQQGVPTPLPAPLEFAIDITPKMSGETFLIDGKKIDTFPVRLSAGEHTAMASLAGYRSNSKPFTVSQGGEGHVNLPLEPELVRLRLSSDLKAGQVSIDGQPAVDLQDGGFASDGIAVSSEHKLTLAQSGKEALSLTFRAEAAKIVTLSSPIKASDMDSVVISNFGSEARIYATNPKLKGGVKGQDPQPITQDGLQLTNVPQNSEIVVVDGTHERPWLLEAGNAPMLSIVLRGDSSTSPLQVEVNVPGTVVLISGRRPLPLQTATSRRFTLPAGKYTIRVEKDGYLAQEQSVELKKGEPQPALRFDLKAEVRVGSLRIEGGTPGAQVLIDGHPEGLINSDGSFVKGDISPEGHSIGLRKANFEDKEIRMPFTAGQQTRIGNEALLTPFGSLVFHIVPEGASVTYKRSDEAQPHTVSNGTTEQVKAGTYVISANAAQHQSDSKNVIVAAGKPSAAELTLKALQAQKPISIPIPPPPSSWNSVDKDGWQTRKGPGPALLGASRDGTFEFDVRRPPDRKNAGIFKTSGRVEWVVDQRDEKNRIEYVLEQKSLSRKVVIDGRGVALKSSVQMPQGGSWNLRFDVHSDKIVIRSGQTLLDEFVRPTPDQPLGISGFLGGIEARRVK